METPLPKLRSIAAFPVAVEAKPLVCLRDPRRYAAAPLLIPYPACFILTLLDGRRSAADVQGAFTRQYGTRLEGGERAQLLTTLDEHHFLESARFNARRTSLDDAFHARCDQHRDDGTRSLVTFASLAFTAS
jgi:hypothetical protein